MAQVAGITTKKNVKGEITHVTINVKKHKETIAPMLKKLGIVIKTDFEKRCEGALTIEQAKEKTIKFLRALPWKK